MAASKPKAETNHKSRIGEKDEDGFITLGKWDIDGWYKAEKGRTLQGIVRDATVSLDDEDKPKLTYAVELTRPCQGKPVGEDGLEDFAPGSVLGLSESFGIRILRPAVDAFKDCEIRATPIEKKKLKGARHMWQWEIGIKPGTKRVRPLGLDGRMSAATAAAAGEAEPEAGTGEDYIPF